MPHTKAFLVYKVCAVTVRARASESFFSAKLQCKGLNFFRGSAPDPTDNCSQPAAINRVMLHCLDAHDPS